jgi:hypothetical protein
MADPGSFFRELAAFTADGEQPGRFSARMVSFARESKRMEHPARRGLFFLPVGKRISFFVSTHFWQNRS